MIWLTNHWSRSSHLYHSSLTESLYYQPKQCNMKDKSLRIIMHLHCMNSCLKFTSLMRRNCQCSKKTTLPKTIFLLNLPVVVKLFQVLPFRKFDSPNKHNLVAIVCFGILVPHARMQSWERQKNLSFAIPFFASKWYGLIVVKACCLELWKFYLLVYESP